MPLRSSNTCGLPTISSENEQSRVSKHFRPIRNTTVVAIVLLPWLVIALCLFLSCSPRWLAQYAAKWYLPELLPFGNVRMLMAHIGPMDNTSVVVNATVVCQPLYDLAISVDQSQVYENAQDVGTIRHFFKTNDVFAGLTQFSDFGSVWARFSPPTRLQVAILAQASDSDELSSKTFIGKYNDQSRIAKAERIPVGYVQMLHDVVLSPQQNTRSNWQVLFNITSGDGYRELVRQILMTRNRIRGKVVLEVEGEVNDVQLLIFGHVVARLEKISVLQLVQLRDAAADEEKISSFDTIRDIKGLFSLLARVINGDRNVMDSMPTYLSFSEFRLYDELPSSKFPALPNNVQNVSSSLPFSMYVHFDNPTGIEFDRVGMYAFQITYNSTALVYFTVADYHLNRYGSSKVHIFGQIVRTTENAEILDHNLVQTLLAPSVYPAHINLTGSEATPSQNLLAAMVQPTLAGVRVPLYEFAPTFLPLLQASGVSLTDIIAGIVPSFQVGFRLPSSIPVKIKINNTLGCTISFHSVDVGIFKSNDSLLGEIHHNWGKNSSLVIPPNHSADVPLRADLSILSFIRSSRSSSQTLNLHIRSFRVSLGAFPITFENVTVSGIQTSQKNHTFGSFLPMLKQAMKKFVDVRELLESK